MLSIWGDAGRRGWVELRFLCRLSMTQIPGVGGDTPCSPGWLATLPCPNVPLGFSGSSLLRARIIWAGQVLRVYKGSIAPL